jgi:P2-related tail formation protein
VLDVIETLQEPIEKVRAGLVAYFDPRRCDARFLPMLVHWVNLDRLYPQRGAADLGPDWTIGPAPLPEGRMRELVALAASLAQQRGTAPGLKAFLETAFAAPFEIDEAVVDERRRPIPFHVRILAPAAVRAQRELITRIIELEKPAYVTFELVFGDSAGR